MKDGPNLIKACLLCAAMLQAADGGAQPVTNFAGGGYHNLFLMGNGSLFAVGYNGSGELGDGTYNNTNLPELIVVSNVVAVAAGQFHSLFIKTNGSLWAMGDNAEGELGDGTYSTNDPYYGTNRPEQIVSSNVTAIAAGGYHSLFIKTNGSLWAMGYNGFGELGDGTTDGGNYKTNRPEQIVSSNVTAIAAGGGSYNEGNTTFYTDHSLFLKRDGSLWAMGDNSFGQLGDGTYNNAIQAEQIVASNVTAIAAGELHSLFLKSDGSLWAMGYNADGELADGTNNDVNYPEQILAAYNRMSGRLLTGGKMQLSFVGNPGVKYALDRAFNLSRLTWLPQATNPASPFGPLVFTNTPNTATNNFWRIRSVP